MQKQFYIKDVLSVYRNRKHYDSGAEMPRCFNEIFSLKSIVNNSTKEYNEKEDKPILRTKWLLIVEKVHLMYVPSFPIPKIKKLNTAVAGKEIEMLNETKMEKVKDLRPIDDVFFEVLAKNIGVCQEMLQVILEDDKF